MIMPFDCTCVFSPQLLSYSSIEIFCWIKCTYYSKGGSIANWINNSEREKKTCNHKTKTKPVKHNNEGENLYSTNRYSMFFYLWVRLRLNPRKRVRDKRKKTLESHSSNRRTRTWLSRHKSKPAAEVLHDYVGSCFRELFCQNRV